MSVDEEEGSVTYQELSDLEKEFDDVETEMIRKQTELSKPLYEKRRALIEKIPNFWQLVLEQAPSDIDQYIQPSDSQVLVTALKSISVSRFEIENGANGDPRSVSIKFEFTENEYFDDTTIEKNFWFRQAKDGWAGLVSEPVDIKWKEGRDLTNGLLSLVKAVWEENKKAGTNGAKSKSKGLTATQKTLKEKIDAIGIGGQSFFTWFGFIGERVSAEESEVATREERERRQRRIAGEDVPSPPGEAEDDPEEDEGDELEIFPDGDSLAVAISDDLWPGALKYFTQAHEDDGCDMSDFDMESDDDEQLGDASDGSENDGDGGQVGGASDGNNHDENDRWSDDDEDNRPSKKLKV